MPPKKAKKAKAESEEDRLAREEEERKAKAAEEKRIAEELERERQEQERIKKERLEYRQNELERLRSEYDEVLRELERREAKRLEEESLEGRIFEWARYKDPSGKPNASIDRDINTFITLTEETKTKNLTEVIDLVKKIELVSTSVENEWSKGLAQRNHKVQSRCLSHLHALKDMLIEKLDQATVRILKFADKNLNDRVELNVEEVAETASIGIWATYNDIRPIRKSVQFEKIGLQVDIPKQVLQQHDKYVYRVIRTPLALYNFEAYDNKPETDKYVVGDLIQFDILLTPPPAFQLRARKWEMRDNSVNSTKLRKIAYPSSVACRMYLKLPETIIPSEDMRVALWSDELQDWVEEGITDYQYTEATRTVQFYVTTTGTFAIVKNRTADLPYKRWSMIPINDKKINKLVSRRQETSNLADPSSAGLEELSPELETTQGFYEKHARLTIETKGHELVIDIMGNMCCLIKPDNEAFKDLFNVKMSPGSLLYRLQRKGIHLLPTTHDLIVAPDCTPKDPVMEDNVLRQIARGASGLEFESSPWNQKIPQEQIGVLAKETTVYASPAEVFEFECVLAELDKISTSYGHTPELGPAPGPGGLKFLTVFGNEYGNKDDFSHKPRPKEEAHVCLWYALSNRITAEATERIKRENPRFEVAVHTLLYLMKPYSLS